MLLSAVSVLVVAQSSSEIPEGLMNNPVFHSQLAPACFGLTANQVANIYIAKTDSDKTVLQSLCTSMRRLLLTFKYFEYKMTMCC